MTLNIIRCIILPINHLPFSGGRKMKRRVSIMKKVLSAVLTIVMVMTLFAGCGKSDTPATTAPATESPATEAPAATAAPAAPATPAN